MTRHLLKIVWHRKGANALIVAELLISFLVVFALFATSLYMANNYRQTLGYDYGDVWSVEIERHSTSGFDEQSTGEARLVGQLLDELQMMEPVTAGAGASTGPYYSSVSTTGWDFEGREYHTETAWATDDLLQVLNLRLVEGRWFSASDEALAWEPVVLNRRFATEIFGSESPVGRPISAPEDSSGEWRVIGVVDDFRRGGEFADRGNFMFQRATQESGAGRFTRMIHVKLVPGTPPEFEETLVRRMQAIAPEWTFRVIDMEDARHQYLRQRLVVLAVGGLIAGFLLVMVVLGLTGVLWQNVTRRTREIGLRRATGATRDRVHRQIVGEVMITAALGLALGVFVALQVALLGPFGFVPLQVMLSALGLALAFMMLLSALCGLYPGWTATRVHPAVALHYE